MKYFLGLSAIALTIGAATPAHAGYCPDSIAISENYRMGGYTLPEAVAAMNRSCRPGDTLRIGSASPLVATVCDLRQQVVAGGPVATCVMARSGKR